MIKFLSICCLFLFLQSVNAQKPTFEWGHKIGDSTFEKGNSIVTDTKGNVYCTGSFGGKVDFNPSLSDTNYLRSNGSSDIFITKFDSRGKFIWAINFGGKKKDVGKSINFDGNGNLLITGYFSDTVDFDPGSKVLKLSSKGDIDVFVCKINSASQLVWAISFGGSKADEGNSIITNDLGWVYITGYFNDKVDFDPSSYNNYQTSIGKSDVFISCFNSKGNLMRINQIGGAENDVATDLYFDKKRRLYILGYFSDSANFNINSKGGAKFYKSKGAEDIFLCKLDYLGQLKWVRTAGDKGSDKGYALIVDSNGISYSTGYFEQQVDFDPSTAQYNITSDGQADVFIWKLDSLGSLIWAKSIGGGYQDEGNGIDIDKNGNIITTGFFTDWCDFDPKFSVRTLSKAVGGTDIFISQLDSKGNYISEMVIGGQSDELCQASYIDDQSIYYLTGGFYSSVMDVDPSANNSYLTNSGNMDFFQLKLSLCKVSYSSFTKASCSDVTVWGKTYTKSGHYTKVIKNAIGCDSVITAEVSILPLSTNSFYYKFCDSITINNQTFYKPGVYSQKFTNSVGCDSTLYLDLKPLELFDTISLKACSNYTHNGITYYKSGSYTQKLKTKMGCDSFITLNLIINSAKDSTFSD